MKPTTQTLLLAIGSVAASVAHAALNDESNVAYIGGNYLGAECLRQVSVFTNNQLLSDTGLTGGLGYGDYDTDAAKGRRFDADFDVMTASLGYTHQFEGFKLGASVSYVDTDFDSDSEDENSFSLDTDGDGWIISMGASKEWEKFSLVVQGGMGELSLDSKRENTFGEKKSDYDTSLYYFSAAVYYELYETEDWAITPFLELGYIVTESDSFSEEVSSGLGDPYSIDELEDDVPYGKIGADFEYLGFDSVIPFLTLAVWQDLGDDEVDLDGKDPIGNSFDTFEIADAAETVLSVTTGASYQVTESLSLDASVGYFSGDDVDGYNLGLAGVFSF